ncbi:DUF3152 domain-containing protein [Streptomyces sp. NPDC001843]|uniref:DUF3152 domain-containing protein n=1 Tax=Streptomyces sp. NPDC001843 TaxID=3364617 RepID=UPI00368C8B58
MGRHSRRGKAPDADSAETTAQTAAGSDTGPGPAPDRHQPGAARPATPGARPDTAPVPLPGQRRAPLSGGPAYRGPRVPEGTPAKGAPRLSDGTPARGVQRPPDGTPARGVPRTRGGGPAQGAPRAADGTPAKGTSRPADGTPARGVPRLPDGTEAGGVSRVPGGAVGHSGPQARGGHPEQREPGGGWGEFRGRAVRPGAAGTGTGVPGQGGPGGPRKEYLDAFDEDGGVFAPRPGVGRQRADSYVPAPGTADADDVAPPTGEPKQAKGAKGRTFAGIAAAAVTTVLAVIVAGQVTHGQDGTAARSGAATDQAPGTGDSASQGTSAAPGVATLTYAQKMSEKYPLSATLKGPGKFDAVPGADKAPGKGRKYTYRVDIEQGLGLDGELFAEAVQKTLNDDRSWAHAGARTFERVGSGKADFVITLASPGTTAEWCAKSGLDTTEDNVSCDSAATERVMINAYRWAQGSKTYGDKIHPYRQMLINHEVGHRLGYGHVTCDKDGELAPVMQQQTKFLNHDGIHCLPNPWPYPKS